MDTGLHPSQHLESDIQPSRNPKSDSGSDDQTLAELAQYYPGAEAQRIASFIGDVLTYCHVI